MCHEGMKKLNLLKHNFITRWIEPETVDVALLPASKKAHLSRR